MKRPLSIVVLGLSLSSSWGNGHATTYRALLRAFAGRGHDVLFLERDVPWYRPHRDLAAPAFCQLAFYNSLDELRNWDLEIATADAVIVGSYVPEGIAIGDHVQAVANGVSVFYDIDTPVTLAKLHRDNGEYITPAQIADYDLYLSFTGGPILDRIERTWRSPAARVLYCSVDADIYQPADVPLCWDLGYLGTYSDDRQPGLEKLLIEPARALPQMRFVVAGSGYPAGIDWPDNVERIEHVPPADHPAFYSACRFALNITRADMVEAGHSPSVRLFEAAACGTPILSDRWAGIETVFAPGSEIILADDTATIVETLRAMPEEQRRDQARAARRAVLQSHTAQHRARELEAYLHMAAAAKSRVHAFG